MNINAKLEELGKIVNIEFYNLGLKKDELKVIF